MSWENLAIIIPTRNRLDILAATLTELKKIGLGEAALWIYDDASDDENSIRELVEAVWPKGIVLHGKTRVGQAAARNVLLRACGKEFALLLDDDSFPNDSEGLARNLSIDFKSAHRAITTFQCRSMADGKLSTSPSVPPGICASFLGGASICHIPSVLAVGGYRDFFIYGYEEPELAMRLWFHGLETWYDPSVLVHHNHFESPGERRDNKEYDYLYARNCILMSTLNMPLVLGLPHGLIRSLRRSFLLKRNFADKLYGTIAGLRMSFTLWRERTPCSIKQALEWHKMQRGHRS